MASESSLIKTILHKSLAEGVYRDVVTRSSSYYYFLGRTLTWEDESVPPSPVDSLAYERETRNEIITIKEIKPSDVAFVIPRIDWVPDTTYDMYDDQYTDELVGINIISGGSGYIDIYDIEVTIEGGGGTGATAVVSEIASGSIAGITLTSKGRGYTSEPTITVTSASGAGADLVATMGISATNKQKIEDCSFYVVTDEYNVYKCLDNNNNARSLVKPTTTSLEPIETTDGYIWKFMYNIPINLRNKFVTDAYIPVVSALTSHFYSNGTIDNIFISNRGKDYTSAIIKVQGDGYREADPVYLTEVNIDSVGTAFTDPTIVFSPPVTDASLFTANSSVNLGQRIYTADAKDFYEVVTPGITSAVPPTHRLGTVLNGTVALKYIGSTVRGDVSITNPQNITGVDITNHGNAYTTAPSVSVVDSTGAGAVINASIGTSTISSITIVSGGSGYVAPSISFLGTTGSGVSAIPTVVGGVITAVTILTHGSGYVTAPTVVVTDSAGSGANLTAVLSGSPITGMEIVDGGGGYSAIEVSTIGDGTLSVTTGTKAVTGVGTSFNTQLTAGEVLKTLTGTTIGTIASIADSTHLTLVANASSTFTNTTYKYLTGTITTSTSSKTVTGTSTLFSSQVVPGQVLKTTAGVVIGTVETVTDNTHITLYANANVALTSQQYEIWSGPSIIFSGGGGAGAVASAIVETGIIDQITLYGGIREIVLVNSGLGYLSPPDITFTGGGGAYAVAKSKLYRDKVISTYIVNPGDNYTSVPTVTFGTPWEAFKEVYTNDQFSVDTRLYTVENNGILGSVTPTHTSGTVVNSPAWVANTSVALNSTVYVSNRLYKVIVAGMTGSSAPTHTSGNATNGSTTLQYIGQPASLRRGGNATDGYDTPATGYAVLRYGAGYSISPTITFSDETGYGASAAFVTVTSEAKIVPIIDQGQVVYIAIEDPGVGYTKADLLVTGDGEGCALVADLSLGNIGSQQANNEFLTPDGTIDAIAIISGGYSYGVANISIEGDGEGATAIAEIDRVTNSIKKIHITNRGKGYTYADIKVTGNGNGAKLRAIISPAGGHGKNSPEEFYARTLMFYSNISNDLNQGVIVANDYRQAGIIKNPRVFNGNEIHQGTVGSACYNVQAPIDTLAFSKDTECYIERTKTMGAEWKATVPVTLGDFLWYDDRIYTVVASGITGSVAPTTTISTEINGTASLSYVGTTKQLKHYRIVSVTEKNALLQSLDNDIPQINDVIIKSGSVTNNFTATDVILPTLDKYSGQMMYIDNKQGFTPSSDETITLRTVIKF